MFLDVSRIPAAGLLESNFAVIDAEVRAIPFEEFEPWVNTAAYVGDWRLFGLWHHSQGHVFAAHLAADRRQRLCPTTRRLIHRVPGLLGAGVSWLGPGCHILPHVDEQFIRSARIHLGLDDPTHALMRVKEARRTWQRGRAFAFDSGDEHEAANEGATPRVALILEVRLDSIELPVIAETELQAR
jgi:aspartyl/asparaginyl beta-hydroxylase (cupin superfamily)